MTDSLVSIVIPCFDGERYVREAIESALGQTYSDKEVIVIDDGSTDGSLEVIKSFGTTIRWESGPNRGGCAARNRGIELAHGKFIQFLDADDVLHPEKLATQLPLACDTNDCLVFCDAKTPPGQPAHPHHVCADCTGDPVLFMLWGGLQTSAPLHRKSWLQSVGGFRDDLPCAQERDLHLRIAAAGIRFQRLPQVLYTVRSYSHGVSSNVERILDQHSRIAWPVFRKLQGSGKLTAERARAFAGLLASDARVYLRIGQHQKAADYFRQAQMMHPAGGLDYAYGSAARILRPMLGSKALEMLAMWTRRWRLAWPDRVSAGREVE